MKHLGDITKINGAEIPPVDCITGGSPCQDLSVAGKREGLAGERSGLFMEQIRIVKEMREHDRSIGRTDWNVRPRYMVWENVPGAFSSNKGKDFGAVLTEIVRISCKEAPDVPVPDKGWPYSGCFFGMDDYGCEFSIAYRLHDAQFWGVPQRRKRIALVADFGGRSAPEILFERKGLRWDSPESGEKRQGTARGSEKSIGDTSLQISISKGIDAYNQQMTGEVSKSLNASASDSDHVPCVMGFNRERCGAVVGDEMMPTLQAAAGESGNNKPMVYVKSAEDDGSSDVYALEGNGSRPSHYGDGYSKIDDPMFTLNSTEHHAVAYGFKPQQGAKAQGMGFEEEVAPTLNTSMNAGVLKQETKETVAYGISAYHSNSMMSPNPHSGIYEADTSRTLDLNGGNPSCNQGGMMILNDQGGSFMHMSEDVTGTLRSNMAGHQPLILESNQNNATVQTNGISTTLPASMGMGGGYVPMVLEENVTNIFGDEVMPTLVSSMGTPVGNTQDGFNIVQPSLCKDEKHDEDISGEEIL